MKPNDTFEVSDLAVESPSFFALQRCFLFAIIWLSLVAIAGLGAAAGCTGELEDLLGDAGEEEETAGEGADVKTQQFIPEHQTHPAGPEGPDEPSQQSGNTHTKIQSLKRRFKWVYTYLEAWIASKII